MILLVPVDSLSSLDLSNLSQSSSMDHSMPPPSPMGHEDEVSGEHILVFLVGFYETYERPCVYLRTELQSETDAGGGEAPLDLLSTRLWVDDPQCTQPHIHNISHDLIVLSVSLCPPLL
jgi:hypothetical protein